MLFLRTIMVLKDESVYKRIFVNRYKQYIGDRTRSRLNVLDSPVFDIMRIVDIFEFHAEVHSMIQGTRLYGKKQWSKMVWAKSWLLENRDWKIRAGIFHVTKQINAIQDGVQIMIWWQIGDISHDLMKYVETMVKLVTRSSKLKSDCYQYKNDPLNRPYCDLCQTYAMENVEHIILHCPNLSVIRNEMFEELSEIELIYGIKVLLPMENNLHFLLGKMPTRCPPIMIFEVCRVIAQRVHQMYVYVLKNREGVG